MNFLIFISLFSILVGCGQGESRFLRKQVDRNGIKLSWYYYSHISNNSPDFVEVEKDDKKEIIYEATRVITNVSLDDKTIIIRVVEPSKNLVFIKNVSKNIFGYKIVIDSLASYDELKFIPDGVKEK